MDAFVQFYVTIIGILTLIRVIMWFEGCPMSDYWLWRSFVWPLEFFLLLFKATKEIWSDYTT